MKSSDRISNRWFGILVTAVLGLLSINLAHGQIPQLINYQGRVVVGSTNFNGSGQFKFALVNTNGSTTYWSNDGTSTAGSQPTSSVTLTVTQGLYSLLLGDTTLTNMSVIPASVFNNSDVRLRVWFNDGTHGFQLLTPDQRLAAVGYAMMAANVPNGAITSAQIANGAVGSSQLASSLSLSGSLTAGSFIGNGSGLSNLSLNSITGSGTGSITALGKAVNGPGGLLALGTGSLDDWGFPQTATIPTGSIVVIMGDSIQAGSGGGIDPGQFLSGLPAFAGIPVYVFAVAGSSSGPVGTSSPPSGQYIMANGGSYAEFVNGSQTASGSGSVASLYPGSPGKMYFFACYGANDLPGGISLGNFENYMASIWTSAHGIGSRVVVVGHTILDQSLNTDSNNVASFSSKSSIAAWNSWLRGQVAALQGSGAAYPDLIADFNAFFTNLTQGTYSGDVFSSDGEHPTVIGENMLGYIEGDSILRNIRRPTLTGIEPRIFVYGSYGSGGGIPGQVHLDGGTSGNGGTLMLKATSSGNAGTIDLSSYGTANGGKIDLSSVNNQGGQIYLSDTDGTYIQLPGPGSSQIQFPPLSVNTTFALLGIPQTFTATQTMSGGIALPYQTASATFTIKPGFNTFTGGTANQTGTMPSPSTAGEEVVIKNQSSVTMTIASNSGSQIIATGARSASSSVTLTSGSAGEFWSDGTDWNQK